MLLLIIKKEQSNLRFGAIWKEMIPSRYILRALSLAHMHLMLFVHYGQRTVFHKYWKLRCKYTMEKR